MRPDGWLIRTNHLLSPDLRAGDAVLPDSTSRTRYDHLDMVLAEKAPDDRLPDLAARLCGAAQAEAPICMKEDPRLPEHARCRTMLTVRLDPVDGIIEYWPGPPSAVAAQGHAHRF
ncbi:MAG: hypothetical protein ACRDOO_17510 [Actinomadura sp.]